ncbi:MAG: FFLEELY motif protein [Wenzhouxiangella sp.]
MTSPVEHLSAQIARNQAVARRIDESSEPVRTSLARLQQWQRDRLDATYADLAAQPRYQLACQFFLDELYGGLNVEERDHQLARVVPVMQRLLPGHLLAAIGDAMRLQAVSLEFDVDLAVILVDVDRISQPVYAQAYRTHAVWDERDKQMTMIRELGELLDEQVARPMIRRLIRMMHGPAVMAGFAALQGFLRRGMEAFARMDGADEFLATIDQRERHALNAMREGSDWPFAEWIGEGP